VETVDNPAPICAHCHEELTGLWTATWGTGHLICGDRACQFWAQAKGLSIAFTGNAAIPTQPVYVRPAQPRTRQPRVCATCKGQLPRLRKDRFVEGSKQYCSLTCAAIALVTKANG
jgi:hypothetical protein